jgi:hypothetical protein
MLHRTLIAATVAVCGALGVSFILAQAGGATATLAAGKHKNAAVKKTVKSTSAKSNAATSTTPHADGTVTAVNGDTITVKADNDPAGSTEYTQVTKITLTSSTKYSAGKGATTTTRPAITSGEYIVAEGTLSSDKTSLTATLVSVHAAGSGIHGAGVHGAGAGPHADGTITAVNGDTLTVAADNDPAGSTEYTKVTTIVLTGTTQYATGKGTAPTTTKPTITTGEYIIAVGTLNGDQTSLTATQVWIGTKGAGH